MLTLRDLQNTHAALHARTARYSDFPSMKTGKNVDGKLENGFSSMKSTENVDDKLEIRPLVHENNQKRG